MSEVLRGAPALGELPPAGVAVIGLVEQVVARTAEERGSLATLGDFVAAVVSELAPVIPALDWAEGERA